jgi:site-specific recombinase XerD
MTSRYPDRGWWFPGRSGGHVTADVVTVDVGRLFHRLGITGSIHRMRHVYATRLIRSGAHIRRVQRLMRHRTLETTAVYTAVDEDELRDAIYALPSTPEPPTAA